MYWRSKSLISESLSGYPTAAKLKLEEIPPNLKVTDQNVFLGQKDGLWYVGIDISTLDEFDLNNRLPEDSSFRDLREVGAILDRFDACILSYCEQYFIGNKITNSVVSAVVKQPYLKLDTKLIV